MGTRLRYSLSNPKFLLAVSAALLACAVQSGELGSSDTMHRLQTAHSFWTSQPPVFPSEYPEFGVHGRGGKLYDWYGIGQPLLLLPFDIVGTYLEKLPAFADYYGSDPTVRDIFVTCSVSPLLNVLTALVCLRFLLQFGFTVRHSMAGVLALLFCTTHLHYTQNLMENNYILLLTLTGLSFQYEWLQTGSRRALVIGSAAFGLNLLTRLTTGLDLIAGGVFLLLVMRFKRVGRMEFWRRLLTYVGVASPVYLFFILIDRAYQLYRFGEWRHTYVYYFTLEHRLHDPTLPAKFPWETPFHVGFLGALFSPEKSVFLFDPLIILAILIAILGSKYLTAELKAYIVSFFLLIFADICLYARYTVWSGDFAWGDRYVSTAVELAAFFSVPLLLRFWKEIGKPAWIAGMFLISVSLLIQLASLAFWLPLEIYQADDFGHPQFLIWLRLKNILAFAIGKMDAWGLNTDAMTYDHWDYQHITTWNFLPFVLRRMGEAGKCAVDVAFGVWYAQIAALFTTLLRLTKLLRNNAGSQSYFS